MWSSIPNCKGHTKINEQVNKYLYNWIIQHPQVVQSPIIKCFLIVSMYSHSESQLVSKLLLKVSVWELHNITLSPAEEGGLNEAKM